MRRFADAVLLPFAVVALTLLLLEGLVRVVGLESALRGHFEPGIFAPDPSLGWALRPGYRGVRLDDDLRVPTRTNALGFRGPEWDAARASAALRVLALGDSCTFGLGVGEDETWPSQLEAALREQGSSSAVFNSGVPGYDTAQQARLLARLAPVVQPHLIVVTWLSNDLIASDGIQVEVIEGQLVQNREHWEHWRERLEHRGFGRSALYRFARVRWRLIRDRIGLRRRSWPSEIDVERFRESAAALASIKEQARALGARTLLIPLPRREQVEGSAPETDLAQIAELARDRGFGVVDVLEPLRRHGSGFLADNVHLDPGGYRVVAREVARAAVARAASLSP